MFGAVEFFIKINSKKCVNMCDIKTLRQIFWISDRNWTVFRSDRRFESQDIMNCCSD